MNSRYIKDRQCQSLEHTPECCFSFNLHFCLLESLRSAVSVGSSSKIPCHWSRIGLWGSLGFLLPWMHPFRARLALWTGFTGPSSIKSCYSERLHCFLCFHYKVDAYKKSHFEVTQYSVFLQLHYVTLLYWYKHRVYFTQKALYERWLCNTSSLAETAQKFNSMFLALRKNTEVSDCTCKELVYF